jgi:hypothetical protein
MVNALFLSLRMAIDGGADEAINWLYPGNPNSHHDKIVRQRVYDSGSWFLESQRFLTWSEDTPDNPSPRILLGRAIRMFRFVAISVP